MLKIGVIAEDQSDVDVLEAVLKKIKPGLRFCIRKFLGRGCGKIRARAMTWANQLEAMGCKALVLIQDLDRRNLSEVNAELFRSLSECQIQRRIVVIPVQEIEAWLLADGDAIQTALGLKNRIRRIADTELIDDPKKELADIVFRASGKRKRYYNTIHNRLIAARIRISELRRCESFRPLEKFFTERRAV